MASTPQAICRHASSWNFSPARGKVRRPSETWPRSPIKKAAQKPNKPTKTPTKRRRRRWRSAAVAGGGGGGGDGARRARRLARGRGAAPLPQLRAVASSRRARCPTCATASSRCSAASSTRCCTTCTCGPTRKYRKCATVVGDVLGKYHPHGDTAIYDALVRMAQDFALRVPAGRRPGNFGSLDGDAAAAYRYTECRLAPLAMELLERARRRDGRLPRRTTTARATSRSSCRRASRNLLVNGSTGIAVGMATNIPPHNLRRGRRRADRADRRPRRSSTSRTC